MKHAFRDAGDGYYEVEVPDGEDLPEWTESLTPCEIQPIAPASVPQQITALQGLLAIDQCGLADAYLAWASSGYRTFAQRAFIDKAQTWRRDDPTIAAASTALGLTSEQVDAMFSQAATL